MMENLDCSFLTKLIFLPQIELGMTLLVRLGVELRQVLEEVEG